MNAILGINSESVVRSCSVKKVFLKVSQNLQEKTSVRGSLLIKLQAWGYEWYNLHKSRDSKHSLAPNRTLITPLDGFFKLTSYISLKSVPQQGWKIKRENHGTKHLKILFFLYNFNHFNKNWGCRGGLLYFIAKLYK